MILYEEDTTLEAMTLPQFIAVLLAICKGKYGAWGFCGTIPFVVLLRPECA